MDLITQLRQRREALLSTMETVINGAAEQERDLTDAESENVESLTAQLDTLSERIDQLADIEQRRSADAALGAQLNAGGPVVTRVSEPELYREDGEHDFVRDALAATINGDYEARDRLHAHNEQHRATTTANLGGFVIPDYALSLFAGDVTEGRPTADICSKHPLTSKTVTLPKQTGRTRTIAQSAENSGDSNPTDFQTTGFDVTAKTIIGHTDVSVQSLDFGSISSSLVVADLVQQYNENLNGQVVAGAGTGGTIKGILGTTGLGDVDGSGASTAKGLWTAVGKGKTEVLKGVKAAATHVIMTPDEWGMIENAVDDDGRPLYGHSFSSPTNVQGEGRIFNGLIVVVDSDIPVSAGPDSETKVIVVRASELLLWEQGPKTLVVDQPGAHTGTVRFVIRGYAAFTAERRPGASAVIDEVPVPA